MSNEAEKKEVFLITMSGKQELLRVTKKTIRGLGSPRYIKLLMNEKYDELLVTPCQEKEPMSFKVPDELGRKDVQMRIVSKAFVHEVLTRNGYDIVGTHRFFGKYLTEQKNAIVFSIKPPEDETEEADNDGPN